MIANRKLSRKKFGVRGPAVLFRRIFAAAALRKAFPTIGFRDLVEGSL